MVEGGMKCVKYLLVGFNLLFFILGVAIVGVGAYVQVQYSDLFSFVGTTFSAPAAVLIAVGVIIFLIAFFGCCGAWKENRCMVTTFAALLIIIIIVELAAGIAAYVYRNQIETEVTKNMGKLENEYLSSNDSKKAWDDLQQFFKCCGVSNYSDWQGHGIPNTYPQSCCKVPGSTACNDRANNTDALFQKGCKDGLISYVKDNIVIVGGIGIGFAVIEILGIIFSCCMIRAIKKEYEVV